MKKENNLKIETFLQNYKNMNLGLDICSHRDLDNNLHLLFSLNMVKEDKKNNNFSSKRNRLVKKASYLITPEEEDNINVYNFLKKQIKTLLKDYKKSKLLIYTKKNTIENEIVSTMSNPKIIDKQELYDYTAFNELNNYFKDTEKELSIIENNFKQNLVYLDVSTYINQSLKTNYLKLDTYLSEQDMTNKTNKKNSEEMFFNCSSPQFQRLCFNEILKRINKLNDKKMAIRTNFTGANRNLFNDKDLISLENFIVNNEVLNNFFGIIGKNETCSQVEYERKIEQYSKEQEIEHSDLSKYNILYTDGSIYKDHNINMVAGAFILETDNSGSFKGVEVRNTSKRVEHEVLAAYLGISEVLKQELLDKPISLITDSDDLAESIEKSLNDFPFAEIPLHSNSDFRKVMAMIKNNNIDINIFRVKSHQSLKSNLYSKHEEVDVMALNAIEYKLKEDNIPNNIKKRKIKK
jgi:hypothetical protein